MTSITDGMVMFCIAATLIIFDPLLTLLSVFKKRVCINQRDLLMKKRNKELKAMLVGVDKISKLNKKQLVDLVIEKNELF